MPSIYTNHVLIGALLLLLQLIENSVAAQMHVVSCDRVSKLKSLNSPSSSWSLRFQIPLLEELKRERWRR